MTPKPKSTEEQIKKMLYLYNLGLSYSKIGQGVGCHHTTCMWHIRKAGIARTRQEQSALYKKLQKEKEEVRILEREKAESILQLCKNCKKKITDKKWIRTRWCSLHCWSEYYKPKERSYIYSRTPWGV